MSKMAAKSIGNSPDVIEVHFCLLKEEAVQHRDIGPVNYIWYGKERGGG